MLWLLMLHIAALLIWCATLIYLPVLVLVSPRSREACSQSNLSQPNTPQPNISQPNTSQPGSSLPSIEHFVFTHFATPFALLAIVSGTLVFVVNGITEPWLIVKLSAVTGLVICHALLGLLILRVENFDRSVEPHSDLVRLPSTLRVGSYLLLSVVLSLIVTIFWLVLAKPALGWF